MKHYSLCMLGLALVQSSPGALASPSYEGRRSGTSVTYEDGSKVSLVCEAEDKCSLTVERDSRKQTVRHGDFMGLILLPRELALFPSSKDGSFAVQSEVACEAYSEGLPAYICLAQLTILDGKVIKTMVFRRTFAESRDAVPMLIDPEGK